MPDFLRITKPLVTQNQNIQPKHSTEANGTFNIQDTTKVVHTHNQSEILKQNNGMPGGNGVPTLLLDLLRDPTVTTSYLKNIFMLEELYKLLPANNKTVTNGMEDILSSLIIGPEYLTEEVRRQLCGATVFSGETFDLLREISSQNADNPDVQAAIAKLLRSIKYSGNQREILDSVANNLSFLQSRLSSSKQLSSGLSKLIEGFQASNAAENFSELKSSALALIKDIENSILFSPSIAKTLSILVYNLSRFNVNSDSFAEAVFRFSQYLTPAQKAALKASLTAYTEARTAANGASAAETAVGTESRVMDSLVKLISQQIEMGTSPADGLKLEKMLHSLLSSPCNFTPLLHIILPLQYNDVRAFAELWLNPDSDEKDMPANVSHGMHLLMVIDIEAVGRFEAELFVYDSTIDFLLFCPKGCEQGYEELMKSLPKLLNGTQYHAGRTEVLTFENTRSLMDVFKSLPYRRVGVDVSI